MVLVAIAGVFVLVPIVALVEGVRRNTAPNPGVLVLAVAAYVAGVIVFGIVRIGTWLGCDEACNQASPDWHDRIEAWQWDVLGACAYAGLAAVLIGICATALARYAVALAALAVAAAAGVTIVVVA